MKKSAKKKPTKKAPSDPTLQMVVPLAEFMRLELREFVFAKGMEALALMLEEDRVSLCGPAYARKVGGAKRAGSAPGGLVMGGRRVTVRKPRVRDEQGEVELPSWSQLAAEDPLTERATEQMLIGVSTRKYARSLEGTSDDVVESGTSRSPVSRRFKAATAKQLTKLLESELSEVPLVAVMLDGIYVDDRVVLVAIGVDEDAKKHILGLWEGATENTSVCKALLNNLVQRGLNGQRSLLFVIDGSPALRKAIRLVFGDRALIQRCQVHKRRNVLGHLPEEMHASVGKAIRDAYRSSSQKAAKKRLQALANQLEADHPCAARSLREGLDATLTLKGMKLPNALERTLSTTNAIENLNGGVRRISRRVTRWRDGTMVLRWTAAALLEHAKGFRRLRGYRGMPTLVAALRANDRRIDGDIDHQVEVA